MYHQSWGELWSYIPNRWHPLHSKAKFACQVNSSPRDVHSCLELAMLIKITKNNLSQKSVVLETSAQDSKSTDSGAQIECLFIYLFISVHVPSISEIYLGQRTSIWNPVVMSMRVFENIKAGDKLLWNNATINEDGKKFQCLTPLIEITRSQWFLNLPPNQAWGWVVQKIQEPLAQYNLR